MALLLPEAFFAQETVAVAKALLGQTLVWGGCRGRILEVEAYLPFDDPAAHAFAGKTKRTQVLFGPPGRAYVYLIYGMHLCLNVVTEPEGTPGCVLLRAVEPLSGLRDMRARRGEAPDHHLASGPGKLTQAFGFTMADYGQPLTIEPAPPISCHDMQVSPRIGITKASDWPLRFVIPPLARQQAKPNRY